MTPTCIIGIAGYSGSGKTTLIRRILPELKKQGLSVGVFKHVHHKLNIDTRGKDTDHFFRAGADYVFAHDSRQGFARFRSNEAGFAGLLDRFPAALDLIVIEGHKGIDMPGIWLEESASAGNRRRALSGRRSVVYRDDPEYHIKALMHIQQELERFHSERAVNAGLLIGGKSSRMGSPKALLKIKGRTLAARSFGILSSVAEKTVLLGSGDIPASLHAADRLADLPGVNGPLAGILSAFRWAPDRTWVVSSVDMPFMCREAWEWLLGQRKPGVWAVLPKIRGSRGVETTGALYEPPVFEYAESLAAQGIESLQEIAKHPKVTAPEVPGDLSRAWSNINTPAEWEETLCIRHAGM